MGSDSSEHNERPNDSDDGFNYYAFFNLPRDATTEQIRNQYKILSRRYHPDKHKDPKVKQDAELMFNKLKKAYDGNLFVGLFVLDLKGFYL